MSSHNQQLGRFGEDAAALWYLNEGYEILERNWRVKEGEVDLICVRTSAGSSAGGMDGTDSWSSGLEGADVDRWRAGDWTADDWAGGESSEDGWDDGGRREDGRVDARDRAEIEDLGRSGAPNRSPKVVVFVEVKTRTSDRFGGGYLAVDRRKQAKLRQLATIWLGTSGTYFDEIRFDVVDVNAKGHLHVWEEAF